MKESKAASPPEGGGHLPEITGREVTRYGSKNAAFRSLYSDRPRGGHVHSPKSVLAARLGPERLTVS